MLNILLYAAALLCLYPTYLVYNFFYNVALAKQSKFPYIAVPMLVQNSVAWMVFGPLGRLWYKAHFPVWVFNRVALAIYGFEFHQRRLPYTEHIEPQLSANPKLLGAGKSYVLVTSGQLEFHTWDSEIAREVAARPKDFRQFEAASFVMSIFGQNVLTTDGNEWARHRRIVAGAVTERVSSVVWEESVRQSRDLLTSITTTKTGKANDSGSTDRLFDLIKQVAIHVLYAAGMGNKQDLIVDDAQNAAAEKKPGMHLSYIDAVKVINENTAGPTVIPNFILSNWPSWLPGQKWLNSIYHAKIEFPIHTREALAIERKITAETGESRNNVMSALIAASERNEGASDAEKASSGKKGPALTDQEVVANLYIFTAAGFDTTANTMSYALLLLCRYPKWQKWIIEEIDSLIPAGVDPRTAPLEYTEIFPKATRLLALMFETLRIFPAIIHLAKQTKTPVTLTTSNCGTFTVPADTTMYINTVLLHTDPEVWRNLNMTDVELRAANDDEDGEDGDELQFRPSRWIDPKEAGLGEEHKLWIPPKGTYLPWSAGPRVCPGQRMAQVEFVAIMLTLFSTHRLEPVRKQVKRQSPKLSFGGDGLGVADEKEDEYVMESDKELNERMELLMTNSIPKLTLEMDVYDIADGEKERGIGMRWIKRR